MDEGGRLLRAGRVAQPASGAVTLNDDNTVTYAPDPGARGEDTFDVVSGGRTLTVTIDNDLAYEGRIQGVSTSCDAARVMLTGKDGFLATAMPDAAGVFRFYALPDGDYAVKARLAGYRSPPSQGFSLDVALHDPVVGDGGIVTLQALALPPWVYHWAEDASPAGHDYAAPVRDSLAVEFRDDELVVLDDASAQRLWHDYRVVLADTPEAVWTQEHAWRLLETLKGIPVRRPLMPSRWRLSAGVVTGDVEITRHATGEASVVVSTQAFDNARPRRVGLAGGRQRFWSRRLHHAAVWFVTGAGTDAAALETILQQRYGLTTAVPDHAALTASTTRETAAAFQAFGALELVELINALEDAPAGLRRQAGLHTLVRRRDGTTHPLRPGAHLAGWPAAGYIEVMAAAFEDVSSAWVHRCLVYERARLLWAQMDAAARYAWRSEGGWGWYRDPDSASGWSTYRPALPDDFCGPVSTPGEDFASSLAAFVTQPGKLAARSRARHVFVRDRVLPGLSAGYVFPGKVRGVDIEVDGLPEADKTARVSLALHALEGVAGAAVWLRDEWDGRRRLDLSVVDDAPLSPGVELRGSLAIGRHDPAGYWRPEGLELTDEDGAALAVDGVDDFGWLLYVDNPHAMP